MSKEIRIPTFENRFVFPSFSLSLSKLSTFANSRSSVILAGPSSRIRISPSVPMELTELGRNFETFHP